MLGSIISAVGSLAGGFMQQQAQQRQERLQREFAQNALSWKAADAERAGISKIFAMGAPTTSYSPVSTGDMGLGAAGEALGKGIDGQGKAGSTTTGKIGGISAEIARAQLEGLKIDNDIKRSELASKIAIATQPGSGGTLDREIAQGADGLKVQKQVSPAAADVLHRSIGITPEVDVYKTATGYAPQVPQQLQEALESDWLGRAQWQLRNRIMPYLDFENYSAVGKSDRGKTFFVYDPLMGQYVEVPRGGSRRGPTRHHMWEYMMERLRQ